MSVSGLANLQSDISNASGDHTPLVRMILSQHILLKVDYNLQPVDLAPFIHTLLQPLIKVRTRLTTPSVYLKQERFRAYRVRSYCHAGC